MIELLDFLQPTITSLYIAIPLELTDGEYLLQIVKL